MRIERVFPKPPPEIVLSFSEHEGWAIVAAISDYAKNHAEAHDVETWRQWARDLDGLLRGKTPEADA